MISKKIFSYILIGFVCFLIGVICYLYYLGRVKLYTYDDIQYEIPMNKAIFDSPIFYELEYLNQSDDQWTFLRGSSLDLRNIVRDFKENDINHVIISGSVYEVVDVVDHIPCKVIFTFRKVCNTLVPFFNCMTYENASGNTLSSLLQVIGFKIL